MYAKYTEFFASINMLMLVLFFLLGTLILTAGSIVLLYGSRQLARQFHIKEFIIGLTIVALSTSMPEFFVSLDAVLFDYSDIAIANVLGSNIFNTLFLYAIFFLVSHKISNISRGSLNFSIALYILLLVCSWFPVFLVPRMLGAMLLVLLILYFWVQLTKHRATLTQQPISHDGATGMPETSYHMQSEQELTQTLPSKEKNSKFPNQFLVYMQSSPRKLVVIFSIIFIVVGTLLLTVGSEVFLISAIELVARLGGSKRLLGLLVISVGTGLPEACVLFTAFALNILENILQKKKQNDYWNIGEGNIIGSNIINVLLITGMIDLLDPGMFFSSFRGDILFLIVVNSLLMLLFFRKLLWQRMLGICFLTAYTAYIITLV